MAQLRETRESTPSLERHHERDGRRDSRGKEGRKEENMVVPAAERRDGRRSSPDLRAKKDRRSSPDLGSRRDRRNSPDLGSRRDRRGIIEDVDLRRRASLDNRHFADVESMGAAPYRRSRSPLRSRRAESPSLKSQHYTNGHRAKYDRSLYERLRYENLHSTRRHGGEEDERRRTSNPSRREEDVDADMHPPRQYRHDRGPPRSENNYRVTRDPTQSPRFTQGSRMEHGNSNRRNNYYGRDEHGAQHNISRGSNYGMQESHQGGIDDRGRKEGFPKQHNSVRGIGGRDDLMRDVDRHDERHAYSNIRTGSREYVPRQTHAMVRPPRSKSSSSSSSESEKEGDDNDLTEDQLMARLMGVTEFDTTKGKNHSTADKSGVNKKTKRRYRQYMNRRGGFNRPLSPVL